MKESIWTILGTAVVTIAMLMFAHRIGYKKGIEACYKGIEQGFIQAEAAAPNAISLNAIEGVEINCIMVTYDEDGKLHIGPNPACKDSVFTRDNVIYGIIGYETKDGVFLNY